MDDLIHFHMCLVGGFLGSYTILLRGNLGTAQTGNLIWLMIEACCGSRTEILLRAAACLLYAFMLAASVISTRKYQENARIRCIYIEIAAIILIGFIPEQVNGMTALLPVFAIAAYQWGHFNGTGKFSSATVFSTGNIRQCVCSWTEFFLTKQEKMKLKALFFTVTLSFYHAGVALGICIVNQFGSKSIWFCLLPLAAVAWMEKRHHN